MMWTSWVVQKNSLLLLRYRFCIESVRIKNELFLFNDQPFLILSIRLTKLVFLWNRDLLECYTLGVNALQRHNMWYVSTMVRYFEIEISKHKYTRVIEISKEFAHLYVSRTQRLTNTLPDYRPRRSTIRTTIICQSKRLPFSTKRDFIWNWKLTSLFPRLHVT